MKKEYCKVIDNATFFCNYCEKLVNVSYTDRTGCGSIIDTHRDIKIQASTWKVLLGTKEYPQKIVDDIQKQCVTNNEIRFDKSGDYASWLKDGEGGKMIEKITDYVCSLGYKCNYNNPNDCFTIEPTKKYKYMTDDTGKELAFFSELDAFNYLSKNGGWYLDHTIPLFRNGYYYSEEYIMARDIDD